MVLKLDNFSPSKDSYYYGMISTNSNIEMVTTIYVCVQYTWGIVHGVCRGRHSRASGRNSPNSMSFSTRNDSVSGSISPASPTLLISSLHVTNHVVWQRQRKAKCPSRVQHHSFYMHNKNWCGSMWIFLLLNLTLWQKGSLSPRIRSSQWTECSYTSGAPGHSLWHEDRVYKINDSSLSLSHNIL